MHTALCMAVENAQKNLPLQINIENEEETVLKCVYELEQSVDISLKIYEHGERDFAIQLLRDTGDTFAFYQIKQELLNCLRKKD